MTLRFWIVALIGFVVIFELCKLSLAVEIGLLLYGLFPCLHLVRDLKKIEFNLPTIISLGVLGFWGTTRGGR